MILQHCAEPAMLRVIPSSLWMDRPLAYTMRETEPGVYEYEYLEMVRFPCWPEARA